MNYSNNIIAMHLRIDSSVQKILSDGKLDQNDIPELVLIITEIVSSPSAAKLTAKELGDTIYEMYNYIMTHYKLFPDDETKQKEFKALFDMCVKLVLFKPNILRIKKQCVSLFANCRK